jgi:hypothetical protein
MSSDHFHIELLELHWLEDTPEEIDRCAHGQVRVTIGNETIVDKDETEGEHWTLSAMAMHLLRTLEQNHESGNRVGDHLIPSGGYHINHLPGDPNVYIEEGCSAGHNFWVRHSAKQVHLTAESGQTVAVDFDLYKREILDFADKIKAFYDHSKSKELPEDEYDRTSYLMFWKEWNRRRNKWVTA